MSYDDRDIYSWKVDALFHPDLCAVADVVGGGSKVCYGTVNWWPAWGGPLCNRHHDILATKELPWEIQDSDRDPCTVHDQLEREKQFRSCMLELNELAAIRRALGYRMKCTVFNKIGADV